MDRDIHGFFGGMVAGLGSQKLLDTIRKQAYSVIKRMEPFYIFLIFGVPVALLALFLNRSRRKRSSSSDGGSFWFLGGNDSNADKPHQHHQGHHHDSGSGGHHHGGGFDGGGGGGGHGH
jgi:hypothetical protein